MNFTRGDFTLHKTLSHDQRVGRGVYIFQNVAIFFSDFTNSFSLGDREGEGRLVSKVCGSIAIRDVQMRLHYFNS